MASISTTSADKHYQVENSSVNGWYEEDCEAAWAIIYHPSYFDPQNVIPAHRSAARWYPEQTSTCRQRA